MLILRHALTTFRFVEGAAYVERPASSLCSSSQILRIAASRAQA